jgi:hypothetical protein
VAKRTDVRKWAVIGAEQRLSQISQEAAAIYRAFPELRRAGRGRAAGRRPASAAATDGETSGPPRGGRRRLSAAARKRISDAQKRRWAKHRAAKKS